MSQSLLYVCRVKINVVCRGCDVVLRYLSYHGKIAQLLEKTAQLLEKTAQLLEKTLHL